MTNREIYEALNGLEWKQQSGTVNIQAFIPKVGVLLIHGRGKELCIFPEGHGPTVHLAYESSPLFAAVIDRIYERATGAHWREWLNK